MKPVLPLFVFIDACGWEIVKGTKFAADLAPHRKRLESVFGYSSACVPSILSGRWPDEHYNWCYFIHDPENSPFKFLRPLRWLPSALTSRRRFRRWLSKAVKARMEFKGYFDLYNIPFEHISLYNFTEKKSPLKPNGMNRGSNIADFLREHGIDHHISDPDRRESENLEALIRDLKDERPDFAFVYLPELDGLLHRVGNQSPEVGEKLRAYDEWLARILETAREHYEEVRLYIFSDHGMANCDRHLDLKKEIEKLPLRMGIDYVVVYDSTMARFWFLNDRAEQQIARRLAEIPEGRILSDSELAEMRCLFPDRRFGELIFLVQEGVLIVPSHMGERPIRAMHGYHPTDAQSYATLLSNQTVPEEVTAIPHTYQLMCRDALLAQKMNAPLRNLPGTALRQPVEAFQEA